MGNMTAGTKVNQCQNTEDVGEHSQVDSQEPHFQWCVWGRKMGRMVPDNFVFLKGDCKTLWDLWHFGHATKGIRPYKLQAKFHDDLQTKADKVQFSRAKKVMDLIEKEMLEKQYLPEGTQKISNLRNTEADVIFTKAFENIIHALYGKDPKHATKRPHELMVNTVANKC